MAKYDLSTIPAIQNAAIIARKNANCEPNQNGYNAAWLHGYADALKDVAEQFAFAANTAVCTDKAPQTQYTLRKTDPKS